jgi:hypothetical protein
MEEAILQKTTRPSNQYKNLHSIDGIVSPPARQLIACVPVVGNGK